MPNPVWRLYISRKMPIWLAYLRAQPSLDLLSLAVNQYVSDNPNVNASKVQKDNFFQKFFLDKDFLNELNPQGRQMAAKVTLNDIMEELKPYANKFPEVRWVYNIVQRHYGWCDKNLMSLKKHHLVVAL